MAREFKTVQIYWNDNVGIVVYGTQPVLNADDLQEEATAAIVPQVMQRWQAYWAEVEAMASQMQRFRFSEKWECIGYEAGLMKQEYNLQSLTMAPYPRTETSVEVPSRYYPCPPKLQMKTKIAVAK